MTSEPVVFNARFGRALTIAVAALCAVALASTLWESGPTALRYLPGLTLPAVIVWYLFGRPAVVVSDAGVELRNVTRTVELPWPAIQRIDTKYALILFTAYGSYSAWAAPAPSRIQALGAAPGDFKGLPESSYAPGGVRPGDLPGTPSGDAASYIRRRWEELRDAGYLDRPRLERAAPVIRWHVVPGAAVLLLTAVAVAALQL